jgi:CubicO group peptidase (beta-lactamase class C family)
MTPTLIGGEVAPGFAPVADAFRENFEREGEIGAALCVIRGGEVLVDLWGGLADRSTGRPWTSDTPAPLFSTGKGAIAAACLLAASRGLLHLDEPIAEQWPGFAAEGKTGISLRHVLEHSSGLILFGQPVGPRELDDPVRMASIIAAMRPSWPPGQSSGYQLATFGSILSALIMRVDARGRGLARFFAEEIAAPLGLAIAFGHDPAGLTPRAALTGPGLAQWLDAVMRAPFPLQRQMLNPFSRLHMAVREVRVPPGRDWTCHDMPSGNAIGTARAIAELYDMLAAGGQRMGISPVLAAELLSEGPAARADEVMGVESCWHLGFVRPSRDFPFQPTPRAFGMPGFGGSFGFADPSNGIGYGYVTNRLGILPFDDHREVRLRETLRACLTQASG